MWPRSTLEYIYYPVNRAKRQANRMSDMEYVNEDVSNFISLVEYTKSISYASIRSIHGKALGKKKKKEKKKIVFASVVFDSVKSGTLLTIP